MRLLMKLKVKDRFDISDLLAFVKAKKPKVIEMTPEQFSWYQAVVRQRVFNKPPQFMSTPIKVI